MFRQLQYKLLSAFSIITLFCGLFGAMSFSLIQQIGAFNHLSMQAERLLQYHYDAQSCLKSIRIDDAANEAFIRTGESVHLARFRELHRDNAALFAFFRQQPDIIENTSLQSSLLQLEVAEALYTQQTEQLANLIRQRGFKDGGLIGQMRGYVHALEEEENIDLASLLMLRRHEKDFLLRKDLSYIEKLQALTARISSQISSQQSNDPEKQQRMLSKLAAYESHVLKVVEVEKKIGLTSQSGLNGTLAESSQLLQNETKAFYQLISQMATQKTNLLLNLFLGLFASIILASVLVSLRSASLVVRPIKLLTEGVFQYISGAKENAQLQLKAVSSRDEIGKLAEAFRKMIFQIESTLAQNHEKQQQLEGFFRESALRLELSEKVSTVRAELEKRQNLAETTDRFLATLCKETHASMGAIWYCPTDEEITLQSTFAYGRKKFLKKQIVPGEGLVGQAFIEQYPIWLDKLPTTYPAIRTGMTEVPPVFLGIVPCISQQKVVGLIEVAFLQKPDRTIIELIESLSLHLALFLSEQQATKDDRPRAERTHALQARIAEQEYLIQDLRKELEMTKTEIDSVVSRKPFANMQMMVTKSLEIVAIDKELRSFFKQWSVKLKEGKSLKQTPLADLLFNEEVIKKAEKGKAWSVREDFGPAEYELRYTPQLSEDTQLLGVSLVFSFRTLTSPTTPVRVLHSS